MKFQKGLVAGDSQFTSSIAYSTMLVVSRKVWQKLKIKITNLHNNGQDYKLLTIANDEPLLAKCFAEIVLIPCLVPSALKCVAI